MTQVNKTNIHDKGQYFTSNPILKQCVCDFVLNNPERVLEPSVGRGDLVDSIQNTFGVLQFNMFVLPAILCSTGDSRMYYSSKILYYRSFILTAIHVCITNP